MLLALGVFQRIAVQVERIANEPKADDARRKDRS
jgi:hypothetical protein